MKFKEAPIAGVFAIELDKRGDDRGFFARLFCQREFGEQGLVTEFPQINTSRSAHKGTLRGLHYQLAPAAETKLVRCIHGAVYQLSLDLREQSATFGQSFGIELTAENRRMAYVPEGCANAFLSLEDDTELMYLVSAFYSPELERGIRWNDPAFGIRWPIEPTVVSDKDRAHRDFDRDYHLVPPA